MNRFEPTRRLFLLQGLALGVALGGGGCAAMPIRQGVRMLEGPGRLGGSPARVDGIVKPGETVTTGAGARMVLVMGEDAFLLGEQTTLHFHEAPMPTPTPTPEPESTNRKIPPEPETALKPVGFTLQSGRVLSVFGAGPRTLMVPTATIGVRGTGLFLQVAPEQDYLCLCYGRVEIRMKHAPGNVETLEAHHHAARYLGEKAAPRKAPMLNHTDEELFMLEALVNRRPPFEAGGYAPGY
ncbi:MAG: hypothetical protein HQM00_11775 [Magnetococcales bacterium]|nr:hypothetical protein [Magnetococcales bacterium]